MNAFIHSAERAETSAAKMQHAIERMKQTAAIGFAAAGVAMTAFVEHGINEAAKFERAMVNVSISTGATGKNLKAMQDQILSVSSYTAQDATTIASEFAEMGKGGLTATQIKSLGGMIAKYADVQMLTHGTDPVNAVRTAIQLMHQEGSYTEKTMGPMLELANKVGFMQPEEIKKVVTQGRYFIPIERSLGISQDETIRQAALMGITGYLGGRGGTSELGMVMGALNSITVTKHTQNAKAKAESALGLIDAQGRSTFFDRKNNQLMLPELIAHLGKEQQAFQKQHRGDDFVNDIVKAFGRGPAGFLMSAMRPETQNQMKILDQKMKDLKSIDEMFTDLLHTFVGLMQQLKTNWNNIFINIFLPTLKYIEPYIDKASKALANIGNYFRDHPDMGIKVAIAAVALGGASFVAASALVVGQLWALRTAILAMGAAAGVGAGEQAVATAVAVGGGRAGFLRLLLGVSGAAAIGGGLKTVGNVIAHSPPVSLVRDFFTKKSVSRTVLMERPRRVTPIENIGLDLRKHVLWPAQTRVENTGELIHNMYGAGFKQTLGGLGKFFGPIAEGAAKVAPWLLRIGLGFATLGLRIIPAIGWIWTAIDVMRLLWTHGTDFAFIIGKIVGFIQYKMWPAVAKAFGDGANAAVNFVKTALSHFWESIVQFFKDSAQHGLGDAVKSRIDAIAKAFQDKAKAMHDALEAGRRSEGPKPVSPSTASGAQQQGGKHAATTTVHQTVAVHVNGAGDAHKVAKEVVAMLNRHAAQAIRTGGGTLGSPRVSGPSLVGIG